jgi:alcohol oxidase
MRFAYKKSRELARRMPFYRGCHYMVHPPFTAKSKAAIDPMGERGPVPVDAPDIEYTAEDDQMIDAFHRAALGTSWHSVCYFFFNCLLIGRFIIL